jgi:hypothetical protein
MRRSGMGATADESDSQAYGNDNVRLGLTLRNVDKDPTDPDGGRSISGLGSLSPVPRVATM